MTGAGLGLPLQLMLPSQLEFLPSHLWPPPPLALNRGGPSLWGHFLQGTGEQKSPGEDGVLELIHHQAHQ